MTSLSLTSLHSTADGVLPKIGTLIPNRIFVGGITSTTTEEELRAFFCSYGSIKDVKVIYDRSGLSKGSYGFVTFDNQETAERLIAFEAESLVFKDRKLNIGYAIRKQHIVPHPDFGRQYVLTNATLPCTIRNGFSLVPINNQECSLLTTVSQKYCPQSLVGLQNINPTGRFEAEITQSTGANVTINNAAPMTNCIPVPSDKSGNKSSRVGTVLTGGAILSPGSIVYAHSTVVIPSVTGTQAIEILSPQGTVIVNGSLNASAIRSNRANGQRIIGSYVTDVSSNMATSSCQQPRLNQQIQPTSTLFKDWPKNIRDVDYPNTTGTCTRFDHTEPLLSSTGTSHRQPVIDGGLIPDTVASQGRSYRQSPTAVARSPMQTEGVAPKSPSKLLSSIRGHPDGVADCTSVMTTSISTQTSEGHMLRGNNHGVSGRCEEADGQSDEKSTSLEVRSEADISLFSLNNMHSDSVRINKNILKFGQPTDCMPCRTETCLENHSSRITNSQQTAGTSTTYDQFGLYQAGIQNQFQRVPETAEVSNFQFHPNCPPFNWRSSFPTTLSELLTTTYGHGISSASNPVFQNQTVQYHHSPTEVEAVDGNPMQSNSIFTEQDKFGYLHSTQGQGRLSNLNACGDSTVQRS